ncbi:uncharacterized protein IUM83_18734 [Phytophthora cinnamomi]|uniref:uncharacterized protein n=1 Tax=Phytophthora cinnamomi TaxID=4785 RepID=UPI00355A3135|nr:hypothetical protein IUM83_18734 [Phytophthora cinnamomi]
MVTDGDAKLVVKQHGTILNGSTMAVQLMATAPVEARTGEAQAKNETEENLRTRTQVETARRRDSFGFADSDVSRDRQTTRLAPSDARSGRAEEYELDDERRHVVLDGRETSETSGCIGSTSKENERVAGGVRREEW